MNRSILVLFGATLWLSSCDTNSTAVGPRAGGEDFPNTVQALGRTLAMGMDSTKDWNGLDSASTDIGTGSSPIIDSAANYAGRFAGILCKSDSGLVFQLGTKAGWEKTICNDTLPAWKVHDSLVIGNYPHFNDSGVGIDTVYWMSSDSIRGVGGYRSYSWLQPYSREFFLVKGDTGKLTWNVRRTAGRWTDFTTMLTDGGKDKLISTEKDNLFWSASRSLVKDAATSPDTSWALWIAPGIAGQPVIGPSDSGLARATKLTKLAFGRKLESGLIVAHRDTLRNYATLWSARTDWNSGLTRWQTAYGLRPDSTLRARDTARLLERFRRSTGNDSTRIETKAILGPSLDRHDKDSLLSVRYERYRTNLNERHAVWEIQSDNPVANGAESKSGSVYSKVEFADGSYAQFHGKWNSNVFEGTWSNGKDSAKVVVSRTGEVKSSTKLP
jgi:hypothetical protein